MTVGGCQGPVESREAAALPRARSSPPGVCEGKLRLLSPEQRAGAGRGARCSLPRGEEHWPRSLLGGQASQALESQPSVPGLLALFSGVVSMETSLHCSAHRS